MTCDKDISKREKLFGALSSVGVLVRCRYHSGQHNLLGTDLSWNRDTYLFFKVMRATCWGTGFRSLSFGNALGILFITQLSVRLPYVETY
jgi:hypothetical protein